MTTRFTYSISIGGVHCYEYQSKKSYIKRVELLKTDPEVQRAQRGKTVIGARSSHTTGLDVVIDSFTL